MPITVLVKDAFFPTPPHQPTNRTGVSVDGLACRHAAQCVRRQTIILQILAPPPVNNTGIARDVYQLIEVRSNGAPGVLATVSNTVAQIQGVAQRSLTSREGKANSCKRVLPLAWSGYISSPLGRARATITLDLLMRDCADPATPDDLLSQELDNLASRSFAFKLSRRTRTGSASRPG